jgi:hypothetical protein
MCNGSGAGLRVLRSLLVTLVRKKSQLPDIRSQTNPNLQLSIITTLVLGLGFGIWDLFGIWRLGF